MNAPSTRAKSTSAIDLRYGRQGGRRLHLETDAEQAQRFEVAVADGAVVYVRCECPNGWWVAAKDNGKLCHSCGATMTGIPGAK